MIYLILILIIYILGIYCGYKMHEQQIKILEEEAKMIEDIIKYD